MPTSLETTVAGHVARMDDLHPPNSFYLDGYLTRVLPTVSSYGGGIK